MLSMFIPFILMLVFSYPHIPLPLFHFDELITDHARDKTNRSVYCTGKIKTIFGRGVESSSAHTEELVPRPSTATSPSTALPMLSSDQSTPWFYNGLSARSTRRDARSLSPSSSSKGTLRWMSGPLYPKLPVSEAPFLRPASPTSLASGRSS